jgi:hypothetical protein
MTLPRAPDQQSEILRQVATANRQLGTVASGLENLKEDFREFKDQTADYRERQEAFVENITVRLAAVEVTATALNSTMEKTVKPLVDGVEEEKKQDDARAARRQGFWAAWGMIGTGIIGIGSAGLWVITNWKSIWDFLVNLGK